MDRGGRRRLEEETGGRTFPQVVLDGEVIGGYRELRALTRSGGLGEPVVSERSSLRSYLTPCNLIYGAIAVATVVALALRVVT
jgi:hypothetical protein